jgi:YVTN family beta-propeller protein
VRWARPVFEQLADRNTPSSLGTYALLEGSTFGSGSDLVSSTAAWSVIANDSWLHSSSSGTANGLATFTFDANPGPTRYGTLTIAGQTLEVVQAGNDYLPTSLTSPLILGVQKPSGIAVDGSGNIYVADDYDNTVKMWSPTTQTVTTVVSSGLTSPTGLAVDAAGNVYIADTGDDAIKMWSPATGLLSTLVDSTQGLSMPFGVAVDASGSNVYIADTANNAIKVLNVATDSLSTLINTGLNEPYGVAVDDLGNVYIADTGNGALEEWNASTASVSTLAGGLTSPYALAVDGQGNVYIVDSVDDTLKEWNASTQTIRTLIAGGPNSPQGVAVDGAGNILIADTGGKAIAGFAQVYVPIDAFSEPATAGSDMTQPILFTSDLVEAAFTPSSDQSWLTASETAAGVIEFSYAQNLGPARTADVTVLGQTIEVTQAAAGSDPVRPDPVVDGPLSAVAFAPPAVSEGEPFTQAVFLFTDALASDTVDDFTAVVQLGDGNSVTLTSAPSAFGQIVQDASIDGVPTFDVQLSYAYEKAITPFAAAVFSVTVYDTDDGPIVATTYNVGALAAPFTVPGAFPAGPSLVAPSDQTAIAGVYQSFDLGSFTDPAAGPSGVDVNWSDGSADTQFTVTSAGPLGDAGHIFAAGTYTVTVTVTDSIGLADSTSFLVDVASPAPVNPPPIVVAIAAPVPSNVAPIAFVAALPTAVPQSTSADTPTMDLGVVAVAVAAPADNNAAANPAATELSTVTSDSGNAARTNQPAEHSTNSHAEGAGRNIEIFRESRGMGRAANPQTSSPIHARGTTRAAATVAMGDEAVFGSLDDRSDPLVHLFAPVSRSHRMRGEVAEEEIAESAWHFPAVSPLEQPPVNEEFIGKLLGVLIILTLVAGKT